MALTTEERTIVDNITSLLQEIIQMESAEGGEQQPDAQPETAQMAKAQAVTDNDVDPTEDEDQKPKGPEMKKAKKAIDNQGDDKGTNASDDVEDRIGELPEETEENAKEVAKHLASLLLGVSKPKVQKSKPVTNQNGALLASVQALTQVVKSMAKRQNTSDTVLKNILEGLGVAQMIENTYEVNKDENRPVVHTDTQDVIREIKKVNKSVQEGQASLSDVRKSIRGMMPTLFGGK